MRAAVVSEPGGPEVFRIQDIEEPTPGPEEALVDVKATALNRADLLQRRGRYPGPPGTRDDVPGLEMAGVVAAVGERVDTVAVGDRVFALLNGGGYGERVVAHHRTLARIPANLSFTDAASIPEVFLTAYDALFNHCNLSMGESALIHAAGSGVGTAAIQLARYAGATTYGTVGSAEKLAKAADLGLDVGINYNEQDFAEVVRDRSGGRGVDVILDVIGAPYWDRNIASLALKGRMVIVGTMGGAHPRGEHRRAHAQEAPGSRHGTPGAAPGGEDCPQPAVHPPRAAPAGRRPHPARGGHHFQAGGRVGGAPLHGEQRQLRQDSPHYGVGRTASASLSRRIAASTPSG